MKDAKTYWNEVYSEKPHSDGKAPSEFLVQMLPRLQKGKVLDIGMGEGANAVYLAQKGFHVKGFDISDVAIEHAQKLAKDTGVEIDAKRADLDLFIMGLMEYESIVMMNFKPPVTRYYSELIRALKQGGTLLVESYAIAEMEEAIGKEEAYRNYFYNSNELLKNLAGLRILFYQEAIVNGKHRVQCIAKKPLDKDAAKYKLFDMQTNEKHVKSKHLELAEKFFKD